MIILITIFPLIKVTNPLVHNLEERKFSVISWQVLIFNENNSVVKYTPKNNNSIIIPICRWRAGDNYNAYKRIDKPWYGLYGKLSLIKKNINL